MFGFADSFLSPEALFMGSILTATSVGITARVLTDLNRLDAPEGLTIIAAAVVDDVLGILILTVVVGISAAGGFSLVSLGWISFKAIGFWLGLTAAGILAAPYLEKVMDKFQTSGAITVIPLALAFLAAGMSEIFGLAFIIGAFSMGLALSTTRVGHLAEVSMIGVIDFLVPVFFVVMGMLVDVGSMQGAVVFGLVVSVLAIFSKVVGSGVPAFATRFNLQGSARVGIGMMPRGEVALIIAGIGLSQHIIGQDLFGVSIMMTVITTLDRAGGAGAAVQQGRQRCAGGTGRRAGHGGSTGNSGGCGRLRMPTPFQVRFPHRERPQAFDPGRSKRGRVTEGRKAL